MNIILFAFQIVAASSTSVATYVQKEWIELSHFQTVDACQKSAKALALERFKCIDSRSGEEK